MTDRGQIQGAEVKVRRSMRSFERGGPAGCVTVRTEGVFIARVITGRRESVIGHPRQVVTRQ